jgi:hypothetical protein
MIKKSYVVQMSYDVTVAEKSYAQKAILSFKYCNKLLVKATDHLNIMKNSFKDTPEIPIEDVMKARAAIRRYRDQSVKNFNEFKRVAFKCVKIMHAFGSDTQVIKLIKSFISSVDALEKEVNNFVDLFDELQSKEFSKNIVSAIESIQDKSEEISDLIEDRIIDYIQSNVLANSWVDSVGEELNMKIEKKKPLILELYNKREDQLNDAIKERNNLVQG